jgi:hypothetical protein
MAFTLYDGLAYWGHAGRLPGGVPPEAKWVADSTPQGAVLQSTANDPWNWLPYYRRNWLQLGGDSAHTGNNTVEAMIGIDNANTLQPLTGFTDLPIRPDVSPVLLTNVVTDGVTRDVLYASSAGNIYAFDAYTGQEVWSRTDGWAPNTAAAPLSAPAIDPIARVIYSVGKDGCLHKYAVDNGEDYFGANLGVRTALHTSPTDCFTNGWPQRLTAKPSAEAAKTAVTLGTARDIPYAYVGVGSRGMDVDEYTGSVTAIKLASTVEQRVFNAYCSYLSTHLTTECGSAKGGGVWARGGVTFDWLTQRLLFATSNNTAGGAFSPSGNFWPQSVLALNSNGTGHPTLSGYPVDSYTVESLKNSSTDFGSTNIMVLANNGSSVPHLAAHAGKDGFIRLINLDNMSGQNAPGVVTPDSQVNAFPLTKAAACSAAGCRVLGPMATWINSVDKTTWVFASANNGINAMQLTPGTTTPSSSNSWGDAKECSMATGGCKGGVTVANGVVYFADGTHLYAMNAATGATLKTLDGAGLGGYMSTPVVANGVVYFDRRAFSAGGISPRPYLPSVNLAAVGPANVQNPVLAPQGTANLGNDENIDPLWANNSVFHTDNATSSVGGYAGGPWWKVSTVGAAHNVRQVVTYNRTDAGTQGNLAGFRILYYTGTSWQLAADLSSYVVSAANPVITVPVNITNPNSIMIQKAQGGGSTDYLHLAEVRVLGD